MSILEAAEHIRWSIEKSPKAYTEYRELLADLCVDIMTAESKYMEAKRAARSE